MSAISATERVGSTNSPSLLERYLSVRLRSERLAAPLSAEDMTVQTMPDVSPTKWHLAHTSWFFERFILQDYVSDYRVYHPQYDYLFNSYYFTLGQMFERPRRGLLSRPGVGEILDYRAHVDAAMEALLASEALSDSLRDRIVLGLNHEQQHQELMLTDIKHVLSLNPLAPAYHDRRPVPAGPVPSLAFHRGPEGIHLIGHDGDGFTFDNEGPRHEVLLQPHAIAQRLITNTEYREFIRDGGYRDPALWLSDGWAAIQQQGWNRPFYWDEDLEHEFTLAGRQALDPNAPVSHISYYEADAFAHWAGCRLPTEAEWEVAAAAQPVSGHLGEAGSSHPRGLSGDEPGPLKQVFGDVWEWTSSPYSPYPGFRPPSGAIGEYNGKFMCNQMVLRGGSCVTPPGHIRPGYRNFFYPPSRWQFAGIRLAKDL